MGAARVPGDGSPANTLLARQRRRPTRPPRRADGHGHAADLQLVRDRVASASHQRSLEQVRLRRRRLSVRFHGSSARFLRRTRPAASVPQVAALHRARAAWRWTPQPVEPGAGSFESPAQPPLWQEATADGQPRAAVGRRRVVAPDARHLARGLRPDGKPVPRDRQYRTGASLFALPAGGRNRRRGGLGNVTTTRRVSRVEQRDRLSAPEPRAPACTASALLLHERQLRRRPEPAIRQHRSRVSESDVSATVAIRVVPVTAGHTSRTRRAYWRSSSTSPQRRSGIKTALTGCFRAIATSAPVS